MKKEEILQKHIDGCQWYAPACDVRVYAAMEEYLQQGLAEFKVEPGLSLEQAKDEVARAVNKYPFTEDPLYENWQDYKVSMIAEKEFNTLLEKSDQATELYAASLTSEIKELREENEKFRKLLTKIADPIAHIQGEALFSGKCVDGAKAVELSNNATWLKNIAKQAFLPNTDANP